MISGERRTESSSGSEAVVAPDPALDFAAWAAFREQQVMDGFERADPPDWEGIPEFCAAVSAAYCGLLDEADGMEEQLGIPVTPLADGHELVADRMVAVEAAARTLTVLPPGISVEDLILLVIERAEEIRCGELRTAETDEAERLARQNLAASYERRSRGEQSYLLMAKQIRSVRFGRAARTRRLPAPSSGTRRAAARPREHRAGARVRSSRGDPEPSPGNDGHRDQRGEAPPVASADLSPSTSLPCSTEESVVKTDPHLTTAVSEELQSERVLGGLSASIASLVRAMPPGEDERASWVRYSREL